MIAYLELESYRYKQCAAADVAGGAAAAATASAADAPAAAPCAAGPAVLNCIQPSLVVQQTPALYASASNGADAFTGAVRSCEWPQHSSARLPAQRRDGRSADVWHEQPIKNERCVSSGSATPSAQTARCMPQRLAGAACPKRRSELLLHAVL